MCLCVYVCLHINVSKLVLTFFKKVLLQRLGTWVGGTFSEGHIRKYLLTPPYALSSRTTMTNSHKPHMLNQWMLLTIVNNKFPLGPGGSLSIIDTN